MQTEKLIKVKKEKVRIRELNPIPKKYGKPFYNLVRECSFFPDGNKNWQILNSTIDATHTWKFKDKEGYCKRRGWWECSCKKYFYEGEKGELCNYCLLEKAGLTLKQKCYQEDTEEGCYNDLEYFTPEDVVVGLRKILREKK